MSAPAPWPGVAAFSDRIRQWDTSAMRWVDAHYEPALAPGLYAALGPAGTLYLVLAALTLLSALVLHWRRLTPATWTLLVAVGTAVEIQWLTSTLFPHLLPGDAPAEMVRDTSWLATWLNSHLSPGTHVAVTAALAGTLASTWLLMALPGLVLACLGAAAAVYAGAVWPSDAVLGCLIGFTAAAYARLFVASVASVLPSMGALLSQLAQALHGSRPAVRAPVVVLHASRPARSVGHASGRTKAA